MKTSKIIPALFIVQILFLFIPQTILCQMETLESVTFTPPKGWTKTPKEGAAVYTIIDKTTNAFCILTIYGSSPSVGNPNQDFANEWKNLVVKPFKAQSNPKTESQTNPEGWQATAGGSEIELSEGVKAGALLTVFSGFGKTISVLTIFNDQSYLTQVQTFIDGIKLDKTSSNSTPIIQNQTPTNQKDPFPDKPGFQPQKPLVGTLKETITMADLAGYWSEGGGIVTSYVNSSNGDYAGTDTTIALKYFTIKSDGTFEASFLGRAFNHTVREKSAGTVTISDGCIILKTTSGDGKDTMVKYQFISYMILPNGGAVVTVIRVGYDLNAQGYTPEQLAYACGHANGVITCGPSGENWVKSKPK